MTESERNQALAEAARWFASLHRGVMTVEARTEYEAWCSQPVNAAAMEQVERAWVLAGLVSGNAQYRLPVSATAGRRAVRTAVLALMCVVSLGVGIVSYSGHSAFWTRLDWVER